MTYIYIILLRRRLNNYEKARVQLRSRSEVPLAPRDMSRRMYVSYVNEMVRVQGILRSNIQPEMTENSGDPGWGQQVVDGKQVDVHFNTSIAKSFEVLEKAALSRRPGLRHRDVRTVHNYVAQLVKAFPNLVPSLCDEYIRTYDRAVFGNHRFTVQEYARFSSVVYEMVSLISERAPEERKQLRQDNAGVRATAYV